MVKNYFRVVNVQSNFSDKFNFSRGIVYVHTSSRFQHRVDSVIESSLRKIKGSKNFALINFSLNFCETTIYDNKAFPENLVAVH